MLVLAAVLQLLIAAGFVSMPIVRHRYGPAAQAAAGAELARQGVPAKVLEDNNLKFDASGHETAAPVSVAAVMILLAVLNLAGVSLGQTLSWIFMPLLMVGNILILWSQLTAVKSVQAAFRRKGDPELQRIDVPAMLKAAEGGFPYWVMPVLQNIRHTIAFGGTALVLVALPFA